MPIKNNHQTAIFKTRLHQSDVPEDLYEDIAQGWRDYYWAPMQEMLDK